MTIIICIDPFIDNNKYSKYQYGTRDNFIIESVFQMRYKTNEKSN